MNLTERRERCRALLDGARCVNPASVFDPVSARIAEDLGFEVGIMSGSIASFAVLGAPDLTVLTMTEFAAQAHRICRAGTLPLLVDADHGYGNALNVRRTVEELETAGVAVLSIEDTLLPAPYGGGGKPQLISVDEGVGKIRAALDARQDPAMVIAARTGALGIAGVDETIARCKAYEAAGADALFLAGLKTRAQLDKVAEAVKKPLIAGTTSGDSMDLAYLASRGVRIYLLGHAPFQAAVRAVYETLLAVRDGVPPGKLANLASADLMRQVSRKGDYDRWSADYLGGG